MKKIRNWIAAMLFVAGAGGATLTVAAPQTSYACTETLLTFPAWYRGILTPDPGCDIQSPAQVGVGKFIWTIVLNIIEVMLQLVGYIAVAFIIVGGFKYMISTGDPARMTKAKDTILNAVIGLGISMVSVGIVNVVAGAIK